MVIEVCVYMDVDIMSITEVYFTSPNITMKIKYTLRFFDLSWQWQHTGVMCTGASGHCEPQKRMVWQVLCENTSHDEMSCLWENYMLCFSTSHFGISFCC